MAQQTSSKDLLIDRLIELAGQTAIVHHIPGRIRLKVKLPGLLLAQDLEVADLVDHFMGILEARANVAARSIVIIYDTGTIAPGLWEQLVNGKKDPSIQNSVREELARLLRPEILDSRK
jgi:nicotinamide riboside kinase